MIKTTGLTKRFGDLTAVDGLDLEIARGEFFAFLGPNAAGKTTTIRMLVGLLQPSAGRASVGGFDIQEEPERAKALLGFIPDFPFLYDKLTAAEFMRFTAELFRIGRREAERKSGLLFEKFGLGPYSGELTENLSHGTRQRLAIASALLHDPKVIVIDEPMVGLDPVHARTVKDELRERSRAGATVFLSTHTLAVAEELADRVGIIHRGKLRALGTVEELRAMTSRGGPLESVFLEIVAGESDQAEVRPGV
jgi:ABC-2 type transport system ATP-binding protein